MYAYAGRSDPDIPKYQETYFDLHSYVGLPLNPENIPICHETHVKADAQLLGSSL